MSYESDQRVVELQFNNKQFEADVSTTISTLDKLQNKLQFEGASKGFDELEKASRKVSFDGLLESVNSIADRFTLKGTVIRKFFDDIANRALNLEHQLEGIFKSMTWMEQANVGWDKYAQKTTAVQTIMGAVANEVEDVGDRMRYVNEQLETLNWFTDETSYNFLDMVNNIGKFTANQVPLDMAVESMQGIATWAAKSGANVTEASRAMYNLSQAISSGALKLLDWKSIELANMGTAEFKQTAIETAEAMGQLRRVAEGVWTTIDGTEVSVKSFRDSLKSGWLSSNVLLQTLNKYGGFATRLNSIVQETGLYTSTILSAIEDYQNGTFKASDYLDRTSVSAERLEEVISELADSQYDFGRSAFAAAQEAKTFQEAIDSVKEAVSTGWMNTFEIVFGDYQEAKRLWTDLAEYLYDVFNRNAETRNRMLSIWKELGGREDLLDGLYNIAENLTNIFDTLRRAWQDVFPPTTWYDLLQLTKRFKEFTERVHLSQEQLDRLRTVVVKVLTPFKTVATVLTTIVKVFITLGVIVIRAIKNFASLFTSAKTLAEGLDNVANRYSLLGIAMQTVIVILGAILNAVASVITVFKNLGTALKNVTGITSFTDALKGVASVISGGIVKAVLAFANAISKCVQFMTEHIFTVKNFEIALQAIAAVFGLVSSAIVGVWEWCGRLFDRLSNIHSVTDLFKAIWDSAKDIFQKIANSDALKTVGKAIKSIFSEENKAKVDNMTKSLTNFWNSLSTGQVVALVFAGAIIFVLYQLGLLLRQLKNVVAALTGFGDVLKSIKGWFGAMQRATQYSALIQIGSGLLLIAGALVILSKVPRENLWDAAGALVAVTVAASSLTAAFAFLGKTIKNFVSAGLAMAAMGVGALALAGALKVLNSINTQQGKFVELATILAGMIGSMLLLSKIGSKTAVSAASMVAFAAGVYILATAFSKLAEASKGIDTKTLWQLIAIIGAYSGAMALMGRTHASAGAGALAAVASMWAFVKVLQNLSKLKIPDLASFWSGVGAMAVMWLALCGGLRLAANEMLKVTAAFALAVGSLFVLFQTIKQLAEWIAELESYGSVIVAAGVVVGGMIGVIGMIWGLGKITSGGSVLNAHNEWKAMLAIAIDVLAVAGALKLLAGISWSDILPAMTSLAICMATLALVAAAAKGLGDGKAIKAMVANIVAITISLMALSFFTKDGISQILDPAMALAIALGGIAAAFWGAGKLAENIDWKVILAMAASVVAVGGTLVGLVAFGQNAGQIIAAGGSMALALMGLAGVVLAAQTLEKLNGKSALISMLGVAIVAAALGAAMYLVISATPDASAILAAGGALFFAAVGLAAAAGVASLNKNNLGGMASLLGAALLAVAIGHALSEMATEADGMTAASSAFAEAVGILSLACGLLTKLGPDAAIGAGVLVALGLAALAFGEGVSLFGDGVIKFASGVDSIKTSLMTLSQLSREEVERAIQSIVDLADAMITAIREQDPKLKAALDLTGQYIVVGLEQGIKSQTNRINTAAENVWKSFQIAFERAAVIRSPSHVMYKDGQYIVYGLADGVASEMGTIKMTGNNVWTWFHDGQSEKLHDVAVDSAGLYAKEFNLAMVSNADEIETTAAITTSMTGSQKVLDTAKGAAVNVATGIGTTLIEEVKEYTDPLADTVKSMVNNAMSGVFGDTYNSIFGNKPIFLSDSDKRKYEKIMSAEFESLGYSSREEAIEKMLGYDPTDKQSTLMSYLGIDPKAFDIKSQIDSMTASLGDYSTAAGGAGKSTQELEEDITGLYDVMSYASEAVEYFYDKSEGLTSLYSNTNPWNKAIKSTEDLVLEHYKLINVYDEEIQAIENFGSMSVEQAKAAKEAWSEYFDSVHSGISQGFGGVFTAPTFSQKSFDAELTSFKTMMGNLEAQENQMTYFTNTLIKLKREGLNEVYLQSLLDAGPENLAEIISWDQLTAEEIKRINAQYEKIQNATTKLTMDYITTTSEQFGEMPQTVERSIAEGLSNMSTADLQRDVYDKTSELLTKVLDADSDWEQFNGTRLGELLDKGIASGVESMTDVAVSAVEQLAKEMIAELNSQVNAARQAQAVKLANDWNSYVLAGVGGGGSPSDDDWGGVTYNSNISDAENEMTMALKEAVGYLEYMSGSSNYDPSNRATYERMSSEGIDAIAHARQLNDSLDNDVLSRNLAASSLSGQISASIANSVAQKMGSDARYESTVSGSRSSGYNVSITQNNYSSENLNAEKIADATKSIAASLK